jgi:hypothetical protein
LLAFFALRAKPAALDGMEEFPSGCANRET